MRWILVDKLLEMNPGQKAVGVRSFSRSELFFMDHFPGFPIVPGVLQVEMIAQVGGRCIRAANPDILTILTSVKGARFLRKIEPGDQAVIKVEVSVRKGYSVAKGHIEVNEETVSEAEVMYAHIPLPDKGAASLVHDELLEDWMKKRENHESHNME
jgi:3-hydroxyacyl-[acyl-carrier-protein] dehydratase